MKAAPLRSTHSMIATQVRTEPATTTSLTAVTARLAHMLALPVRVLLLAAPQLLPLQACEVLLRPRHQREDLGRRGQVEGCDPELASQRREDDPERPGLPRWPPGWGDRRARRGHRAGGRAPHGARLRKGGRKPLDGSR